MEAIQDRVEKALEKIRPYLVADGGDISVVDITEDMVLKVEMKGGLSRLPLQHANPEGRCGNGCQK